MLIQNITGVTETAEIVVTKGIGALVIATTETYANLATETISIYVEKAGKNKDIARDMLLKDFLLLGTYGDDAFGSDATYANIGVVELTEDGGYIDLKENETIKIQLRGLDSTKSYLLHGIEELAPATEVLMYIRKTMASDTLVQDFDVKGYDLLCMTKHSSITEVALTGDNGNQVKYTVFELESLQRQLDPISQISNVGAITQLPVDRILIPLKGIVNVNIRKSAGTMLELAHRIDESDWLLYQSHVKQQ